MRVFLLLSLVVSVIITSHFASEVFAAMKVWTHLTDSRAPYKEVEDALDVVNEAERTLIPYALVTVLLTVPLVRSVEFKFIPRYCLYCGKRVPGRKAIQSPDRLFWFCSRCLSKRREGYCDS